MPIFTRFTPISTALLPNAELDDIFLVLRLFLPWNWGKWREGEEISELEDKFSEYFGVGQAISFSSGRVGLYAILSVIARRPMRAERIEGRRSNLEVPALTEDEIAEPRFGGARNDNSNDLQPSEVILQAYTTIALPLAIKRAGFSPVYVDIKEDTFNIDAAKIEQKITANTKAIIVQHTFGIPAEMDKISEICKKHNLILIEDCAHSLGAEFGLSTSSGQAAKKIGTFGDAAFFSFGRDKIISSTSGGIVIIKNKKLAQKIKEFRNSLNFPPIKWIVQQLAHPLLFWFALPVYYFFNIGKIKIFFWQKLGLVSRAYSGEEKSGNNVKFIGYKFPNVLAALVNIQFKKIERFNSHRQKIAEIYTNLFSSATFDKKNEIKLPGVLPQSKPTFLYYTIQADHRDELLNFAAKKHIILGDWFPGALGPKGIDEEKFGYKKGDCPIAERVGLKSLNLPTNIKTSEEDARKVAGMIKEFYKLIVNNQM